MPWVRLDESFADHPKIERVGPLAAWLHIAALCYSSRHLTDGRIPKAKAVRLADIPDPAEHVSALLSEGLWVDNGTDYVIHDYLDYQPSRESVLAERSAARNRMAKKRSAARSPEVPPNQNGSSASPSRPVPIDNSLSSSRNSQANAPPVENPDDDEIPAAVWTHLADLKLALEPAGSIRNPIPWKHRCAQNARVELAQQAATWWASYDLATQPNGPYQLAQALIAGRPPQPHNTADATCQTCHGIGWILDPDGDAIPCTHSHHEIQA